jgi:hypothetical protein
MTVSPFDRRRFESPRLNPLHGFIQRVQAEALAVVAANVAVLAGRGRSERRAFLRTAPSHGKYP